MRTKTRNATGLVYNTGDKVYYKKKNSKRWHGPAIVIGRTNKQVFVKHGGTYLRVNPCNVRMVVEKEMSSQLDEADEAQVDNQASVNLPEEIQWMEIPNNNTDHNNVEDIVDSQNSQDAVQIAAEESNDFPGELIHETQDAVCTPEEIRDLPGVVIDDELSHSAEKAKESGILPTSGSKIQYKMEDGPVWKEARVIGRAGKATGKNKGWCNIQDISDDSFSSINFEKVKEWNYKDEEVLYVAKDSEEIIEAKMKELMNDIFEVPDRKRISSNGY